MFLDLGAGRGFGRLFVLLLLLFGLGTLWFLGIIVSIIFCAKRLFVEHSKHDYVQSLYFFFVSLLGRVGGMDGGI